MYILHQEGSFFYCPFFTDLFKKDKCSKLLIYNTFFAFKILNILCEASVIFFCEIIPETTATPLIPLPVSMPTLSAFIPPIATTGILTVCAISLRISIVFFLASFFW